MVVSLASPFRHGSTWIYSVMLRTVLIDRSVPCGFWVDASDFHGIIPVGKPPHVTGDRYEADQEAGSLDAAMWSFWMEEDGISAMEYSLIGALIVVGVITTTHELSISLQDNIYEVVGAMAEVI